MQLELYHRYLDLSTPKSKENKNKLVINNEQSRVIQKIFNMFDDGITIKSIAENLKEQKIYCPDYYDFGEVHKDGREVS